MECINMTTEKYVQMLILDNMETAKKAMSESKARESQCDSAASPAEPKNEVPKQDIAARILMAVVCLVLLIVAIYALIHISA